MDRILRSCLVTSLFYSVLGDGEHSSMALYSAGSVTMIKPHLRVGGNGFCVGVRESVVDLQFSMYVFESINTYD